MMQADYALEDRYRKTTGRVYLSGSQALVRLPMMQRVRDLANGLNSAGFISGYTGSPLGGYDTALKAARKDLDAHHIVFQPGINEELGATAVWGSQQTDLFGEARYDGVFALWYGKGPGLDRAGDALKHGSYAGSSRHGGVLVLAGDDHGAKSSTIAHQSDHAFIHYGMPYLNPSSVQDYLDYGLYGIALSRFSGCWIGMKCVTDTIESSASVDISQDRLTIALPGGGTTGEGALNARWGIHPVMVERRHYQERMPAVHAFVRANGLNRPVIHGETGLLGIVTTGKAHLDLMQALEQLGLDRTQCLKLGIGVFKVAMPWPLEPEAIADFARGYANILVVEEKRPVIEPQLASMFVNDRSAPNLLGKLDAERRPLVPAEGELNAPDLAAMLAALLARLGADATSLTVAPRSAPAVAGGSLVRLPSFCAGCPHNSSTRVPQGSIAFGGIGCHGMATFLPERNTPTLFQMGGEGAPWIGLSPFTNRKHIFQNLGDGTYYHSGLLAIRAAVAAGINITYKILVNDAIAMTGGQSIEGNVRVDALTRQVHAEGARRIAVVSDDIAKYDGRYDFAPGVTIHHRDDLDLLQKELRETEGVSILVYEQYCATELRRRRKRGRAEDPDRRIFINPRICEGCGDCGVQSNCIAIEPVETPFGRKRRINQSACNKDFSCTKGYCPSFVTVHGGTPKTRSAGRGTDMPAQAMALLADLPEPVPAPVDTPFSLLITGIGGAGVVTIGALIGMAAHLEGKGCSVLDVAGLAQRNGPVTSHVRIAAQPDQLHATRITIANLVLGCDIVVTTGQDVMSKLAAGASRAVVNTRVAPTSAFAGNPDLDLGADRMMDLIRATIGTERAEFVDAGRLAYALLGNEIAANLFLVGYALQRGWMPLSLGAILKAIELNDVGVAMNKAALAWGRIAAADPAAVQSLASDGAEETRASAIETAEGLIDRFADELVAYQDRAYAARYRALAERVRTADRRFPDRDDALSKAVARYLYKLMAFKDEYEVARLYSDGSFMKALRAEFDGDLRLEFHMAPPILQRRDPVTGRYRKRRFGRGTMFLYRVLAKLKFLRGTVFDIFGHGSHRKAERALIADYEAMIASLLERLDSDNYDLAVQIASYPEQIRGYDTVKDAHLEKARARLAEQRERFFTPAPAATVPAE